MYVHKSRLMAISTLNAKASSSTLVFTAVNDSAGEQYLRGTENMSILLRTQLHRTFRGSTGCKVSKYRIAGNFGEDFNLATLQKIAKFKTANYCDIALRVCDRYRSSPNLKLANMFCRRIRQI